MSAFTYIFVHGLSGWGSYDKAYRRMPYWGMRSGDLISFLRGKGFDCYAASVSPTGSAWDRACELYAQLAGTKTDYGTAHSRRYRHDRFGRDFTDCPLIPRWNDKTQIVLLGHSFGGATVRLLSELMAHGDGQEQAACGDVSPLFAGGMQERIHGIVTLASPMNGTTAYDLFLDPSFDPGKVAVPWWSKGLARMMSFGTKPRTDQRDSKDYADYDMHIDHALEMNARISTLPSVYYFSVPCSAVRRGRGGTYRAKPGMEPMFVMRANQIGAYSGKTGGGMTIDESWRENDGLVNTVSEMAPLHAPSKPLDKEHIEPGIWDVFPTVDGDHMWVQGGLMHKHDVRGFYQELLSMIEGLPPAGVPLRV